MNGEMVERRNLTQIANWFPQLRLDGGEEEQDQVLLPPLQRGWVWKPEQVEALWDSMMRGFPISSFVWIPIATEETQGRYSYTLLDGQQRAKAIALGFWNPWREDYEEAKGEVASEGNDRPLKLPRENVLWVDLKKPEGGSQRRRFVFRLVTQYHPWGFNRTDPSTTLETRKIREAVEAFKKANKDLQDKKPSDFGLNNVWPWDAEAPIPVSFLIEAVRNSNDDTNPERILIEVKNLLKKLPFWEKDCKKPKDALTFHKKVEECVVSDREFVPELVIRLSKLVIKKSFYHVPIIQPFKSSRFFSLGSDSSEQPKQQTDGEDELEILFERFNRGGTRLEGEELIYSLLKSTFPKVASLVENQEQRLVPPSRYVSLASRLLLAEQAYNKVRQQGSDEEQGKLPSSPNVARFRSLIRGGDSNFQNFKTKLEEFIKCPEGGRIFSKVYTLLTEGDFGLPSLLAVNVARSSPDLLFLLLFVLREEPNADFDEIRRKKLIGMITAITFFGDQKMSAKSSGRGLPRKSLTLMISSQKQALEKRFQIRKVVDAQ